MGDAEQSVTYADRSGDAFSRKTRRARVADVLHQAGCRAEAEKLFREAEEIHAKNEPANPLLHTLSGFQYCDLLLAAPERAAWGEMQNVECRMKKEELVAACRAVSQRAAQTLKWAEQNNLSLLTLALDHLTLGRAALYAAILERSAVVSAGPAAATPDPQSASGSSNGFFPAEAAAGGASPTPAIQTIETARRELDAAVAGLRRAGTTHHIPCALLTRAWLRFLTGACTGPERAQADLDESWEIAERGPMKLFLADVLLSRARLFGMKKEECRMQNEKTPYPWKLPQDDLAAAEKLINTCGYHRRDEELADAKQAILGL